MFKELYLGEFKKTVRLKPIIVMSVLLLVCFGITCLIYGLTETLMDTEIENEMQMNEGEIPEEKLPTEDFPYDFNPVYSAENIDYYIQQAEISLQTEIKARDEYKPAFFKSNAGIYQAKANVVYLKYIKEKGLYGDRLPEAGNIGFSGALTPEGFLGMFATLWTSVVLIYGIILGAGSIAQEFKNGTLKMMLMRPITRTKLYLAKLASMLTTQTVLFFTPLLLVYAYSAIRYDSDPASYLYLFNASKAFTAGAGYGTFVFLAFSFLSIIFYTVLAYSLGTLFRNNAGAIAVSIGVNIGIISSIFSITGASVSVVFPAVSLGSLTSFFSSSSYSLLGGGSTYAGNFFISLAIVIFYLAAAFLSSFFVFKKKDVA